MILVDKTFEIVTHESAEHGEIEDAGFSSVNESMTFRELVDALKREFIHASQSPDPQWYGSLLSLNKTI
jgi:hypothetical protein